MLPAVTEDAGQGAGFLAVPDCRHGEDEELSVVAEADVRRFAYKVRGRPIADLGAKTQTDLMGTKHSVEDIGAYEALDRLLFRQWDPIGVYEGGGPDDEYRSYLPRFWEMVRTGASDLEIVEYLAAIERDRITLETTDEHRLDIARKAAALVAAWRLPVRP